ncbi:MAG: GNAT family N-acetyltransferase [Erysipelotrichaceae bacterium]
MIYSEKVVLKNGKEMIIRNGDYQDGQQVHDVFKKVHKETDFLLTYADEFLFDEQKEAEYLQKQAQSAKSVELVAIVDGKIVGTGGINPLGNKYKISHRCDFGIAILKDYWGLSIGSHLTAAAIKCAEQMGYGQIELEVVSDNVSALALYEKYGFTEYGRNPNGFVFRYSGPQETVLMYKVIGKDTK